MDFRESVDELKKYLDRYLAEKGISVSGNFICLNPSHPDHDPSMSYYINEKGVPRVHCFPCNADYGIIELIAMDKGLNPDNHEDMIECVRWGCEHFGIQLDEPRKPRTTPHLQAKEKGNHPAKNESPRPTQSYKSIDPPDFTEQVERANKILLNAKNDRPYNGEPINTPEVFYSYLRDKRGVTEAQIREYKIGFSPSGINGLISPHLQEDFYKGYQEAESKSPLFKDSANASHKLILPNVDPDGKSHYFYAEITDRTFLYDKRNKKIYLGKYLKPKGLKQEDFNNRYLKMENPPEYIVLCEGFYDVLAFERAGIPAIGLIGLGYKCLKRLLEQYKPKTRFLIALDSDKRGQEATKKIQETLSELGYEFDRYVLEFAKDADEAWQKDPLRFEKEVQEAIYNAPIPSNPEIYQEHLDSMEQAYLEQYSPFFSLESFIDDIIASQNDEAIPTGIENLDAILEGGLFTGLYAIGAVSSLGKTTFCIQLMDNIARAGYDVLFLSLEMSKKELMAKSISRLTLEESVKAVNDQRLARSTREILTGSKYKGLNSQQIENIYKAVKKYSEYARHACIKEAGDDFSYKDVEKAVKEHIEKTGRKPVLFIDYLQILDPPVGMERATQKDNMDKTVKVLKHISRDYDIPVIAISSFNRSNYDKPVKGMDSFKESGGIEYSCDFCLILDYEANPDQKADKDKIIQERNRLAREGHSIPIVCRIEKNRNGSRGKIHLDFFPKFNFYRPSKEIR